jgi:phosphonate dehydrogenase
LEDLTRPLLSDARPKVVVTHRIHAEAKDLLSTFSDVVMNDSLEPWPRCRLLELSRDADALMVFMPDSLDDAFLAQCSRLKIVSAALKGYDNFDIDVCTRRGIWFSIVPDLLTQPTAELALALILGLARNLAAGDRLIRGGEFRGWRPVLYGASLYGATVGIVGFGRVGHALAGLLKGFSCRILYCDPAPDSSDVAASTSLDQLLAKSQFVVPLLPLTPQTFHLFNAPTLAKMKRGSFLINVARGSVVDEEAIADALDSGQLAGYAADTFEMEDWARPDRPQGVSPRLLCVPDRTLFTPHLGSAVDSVRLEIELAAASDILRVLGGKHPEGAVNNPTSQS